MRGKREGGGGEIGNGEKVERGRRERRGSKGDVMHVQCIHSTYMLFLHR